MPGRTPFDVVRCPAGVVRDLTDTVRRPADFIQIVTYNDKYIFIKMRHHSLCYGHKSSTGTVRRLFHHKAYDSTAPVRRPAGGRKILLAPVRRLVGSLRVTRYRPGTVPCPDGARPAFAHIGRATDAFCIKTLSYDSNGARPGTVRCLAGHRTLSDKRKEH